LRQRYFAKLCCWYGGRTRRSVLSWNTLTVCRTKVLHEVFEFEKEIAIFLSNLNKSV